MNIVLQHFDGELRELDKLSVENIKRYAEFVGAEYKLILGRPFRSHLTSPCQKVFMLDASFDEYDDVLMLDIDMFTPKNMNENVFELPGIGLHGPMQTRLRQKLFNANPMISSLKTPYWGGAIYKIDREGRQQLREGLGGDEGWMQNYNRKWTFEDEGIMHTLAFMTNYSPKSPYLDEKWCHDSYAPGQEKAGFIHIRTKITPRGPEQEKINNLRTLQKAGII